MHLSTDQLACKPVTECSDIEEEEVEPSIFSDRVCGCKLGLSFDIDGTGNCESTTSCMQNEIEFFEPTLTSNRLCVSEDAVGSMILLFENEFSILNDDNDKQTFLGLLITTLDSLVSSNVPVHFRGNVSPGSIMADIELSDKTYIKQLYEKAEQQHIQFFWPAKNTTFVALPIGPCASGHYSSSGRRPGCTPCLPNTYVSITWK